MSGPAQMSRVGLVAFCGLLLSVSAFSCDITLPAFWSIQQDLGAPIELVQAIVPVFLMSQGVGQLIFGPVSDRFGRKPVILGGLALYLAGTVIAMLAPAIGVLHAGRAAQGFGSACGIAVGRAVLRDTSHGPGLAQAMALAMAIFAFGPMTAPLIGYGLVAVGSWRAIFIGMGLFAAGLMVWGLVAFRETNARTDPEALRASRLMAALTRMVRHPQSRFFLLMAASAQFGIVSFVANAPRLFKTAFGVEGLTFALLFASTGLGIVVGQISNRRLIARFGVLAATRLAALVLLAVTTCVVGITLLGAMSAPLFTLLMFAFNTSFLALIANCASLTIDPHPQIAGFASSVFGFFTQMTASVLALATLPLFAGAMLPWALGMLVVKAGVFAALLTYRVTPFTERHGV